MYLQKQLHGSHLYVYVRTQLDDYTAVGACNIKNIYEHTFSTIITRYKLTKSFWSYI